MAVVTLTFTDEDLDTGRYSAEIAVQGSQIDDGFMTAAHVTGVYIMQNLHDPEFQKAVWAYAEKIAGNPGCSIGNADLAPGSGAGEIAA